MSEHSKKKQFLKIPRYTGGKEAFIAFLKKNLQYPKEAVQAGIEGTVIVAFEIDDNGIVHQPQIVKGIGYGCDEEALRLVGLLRYEKVKNKGVRLRSKTKANIRFQLPKQQIQYTISPTKKKEHIATETAKKPPVTTYTYTINLS